MAENLTKFQGSRASYRAHLTKTLKRAGNILTKANGDSLTDSEITSLNGIIDQLTRKRSILIELDEKFAAMLKTPRN